MDNATTPGGMGLAQTIVLAPNQGASRRAAAISAPRLAMPTQNTTISSSGARLVVTPETYRPCHGAEPGRAQTPSRGWQRGHQYVGRSWPGGPWSALEMRVP